MKKGLLLCLAIALGYSTMAQVAQRYPVGFRKANAPAALKNYKVRVPLRAAQAVDNGQPLATQPPTTAPNAAGLPVAQEETAGYTYYDLQTNNSISNRLVVNGDGTFSCAWTFSPDAIQITTPIFPNRGTGYNYLSPAGWLYPGGPTLREEGSVRTGFTNIVVSQSGAEMSIAHSAAGGDSNQIAINWRAQKGTGAWTLSYPWGHAYDTWPKACAGRTNNNVYVVFQGSGAAASTTAPPHIVAGQNGPIFFAKSTDGGQTWGPKTIIQLIDSTFYKGFGGDEYSIDAIGDTVAIVFSDPTTDVGLLKSYDAGVTWTKTIIQQFPIPMWVIDMPTDTNADSIADRIPTNSGDAKVLLDNNGMAHVWFSDYTLLDDSVDLSYNYFPGVDNLFYWNESLNLGQNGYIAAAQDFNGDSVLNVGTDTTTCGLQWGTYGGGITQMPSAGINPNTGIIYLTYQTIDESADVITYKQAHRHVYMMTLAPPYDPNTWTYPYDIVPSIADGGNGYLQEAVFACTGRLVDDSCAYVLYQRDEYPGVALAATTIVCDHNNNNTKSSDIIFARVKTNTVGIETNNSGDLFITQNYPNPAVNVTYFNINLKKNANVKINVYDLIGKSIYSQNVGSMPAGLHTMNFNTANWSPGIYTYTVEAGGQKSTKKMIVQ